MLVQCQKLSGMEIETWWEEGSAVTMYSVTVIKHADGYTDCQKFTDGSDSTKTLTKDYVLLKCPGEPDQWMRLLPTNYDVANKAGGWSLGVDAALALNSFIEHPPQSAPARDSTAPGPTAADNRPGKARSKSKHSTKKKRNATNVATAPSAKRSRGNTQAPAKTAPKTAPIKHTRQSASRTRSDRHK